MIAEKALRLAGDGAHLVHRPGGRLHVYTGPLTPSGRFVPRSARTVCRTRTRRLEVLGDVGIASLDLGAAERRVVCGRCSVRLCYQQSRAGQPRTRAEWCRTYADLTKGDVAVALELAVTPEEVDAAAHLSLALFDVAGTLATFTDRGRDWPPLHDLVIAARTRVHGYPDSRYTARERDAAQSAAGRELAIARAREAKADREARITRIGVRNVQPTPRRRPRRPTNGVRP